MTRMLASVATIEEAEQALAFGADFIDLKDPARGALGAWPLEAIPAAVRLVGRRRPISATIGDLPMRPAMLAEAAARTAGTGVDIVKVGFFEHGDHAGCIEALATLAACGVRLVAVLFADRNPDLDLLPALAAAGFHGVMLDTADKRAGGLREHLDDDELDGFVRLGRKAGLLTGLAGSLELQDIAPLVALSPDYLGFRGALCRGAERTAGLDPTAFQAIRKALSRRATAAAGAQWAVQGAAAGVLRK
jgi:(5-formylfuran-3-yl)methyl phosphate synthase